MTMSDRERRLLDELAQGIEQQDPGLAAAFEGWAEAEADRGAWRRRAGARLRDRGRRIQQAPLPFAVAAGSLFVGGILLTGGFANEESPGTTTITDQTPAGYPFGGPPNP